MTTTGTRDPAPGSLALVQKFINSNEMPDGVDELRTAPLAAQWLHDATGADLTVSERDLERLIATREALRDLLEGHTGENVDPAVAVRTSRSSSVTRRCGRSSRYTEPPWRSTAAGSTASSG